MSARENILKRLRSVEAPFSDVAPINDLQAVLPLADADLLATFSERARALSSEIHHAGKPDQAVVAILEIIGDDKAVSAWNFDEIPLDGLAEALAARGIHVAESLDAQARVGITGVDVALAATGSIVVSSRPGRPRSVSLLPHVHIAVLRTDQILPDLETWLAAQSADPDAFCKVANHVVITGASRTADIGMELVLGAHGPATLHLVIVSGI